jgi:hypothetical protein
MGKDVDKQVQRAALEGHPLLTGVAAQFRADVEKDFLQRNYGSELAELNATSEALDHAEASVTAARNTLATSANFGNPQKFQSWFDEASKNVGAVVAADAREAKKRVDDARELALALHDDRLAKYHDVIAANPELLPDIKAREGLA